MQFKSHDRDLHFSQKKQMRTITPVSSRKPMIVGRCGCADNDMSEVLLSVTVSLSFVAFVSTKRSETSPSRSLALHVSSKGVFNDREYPPDGPHPNRGLRKDSGGTAMAHSRTYHIRVYLADRRKAVVRICQLWAVLQMASRWEGGKTLVMIEPSIRVSSTTAAAARKTSATDRSQVEKRMRTSEAHLTSYQHQYSYRHRGSHSPPKPSPRR